MKAAVLPSYVELIDRFGFEAASVEVTGGLPAERRSSEYPWWSWREPFAAVYIIIFVVI